MRHQEEMLAVIKAVVSHGHKEGVEKLTMTWEQGTSTGHSLQHSFTVTYVTQDKGENSS